MGCGSGCPAGIAGLRGDGWNASSGLDRFWSGSSQPLEQGGGRPACLQLLWKSLSLNVAGWAGGALCPYFPLEMEKLLRDDQGSNLSQATGQHSRRRVIPSLHKYLGVLYWSC